MLRCSSEKTSGCLPAQLCFALRQTAKVTARGSNCKFDTSLTFPPKAGSRKKFYSSLGFWRAMWRPRGAGGVNRGWRSWKSFGRELARAFLIFLLACFWRRLCFFAPEAVAGAMDEDVFEGRFADAQRLNFSGEGFDDFGHEMMSVFNFQPNLLVHNRGFDLELGANFIGQGLRISGFEQNHVTPDLSRQFLGR